jgi:hypothetical protein
MQIRHTEDLLSAITRLMKLASRDLYQIPIEQYLDGPLQTDVGKLAHLTSKCLGSDV